MYILNNAFRTSTKRSHYHLNPGSSCDCEGQFLGRVFGVALDSLLLWKNMFFHCCEMQHENSEMKAPVHRELVSLIKWF